MAGTSGIQKRAPRIDLRKPAVVINSDGAAMEAIILDVSSGGFRIEVSEAPRIGEYVTLRVDRGEEFTAQIRWALGNEAGGIFLTPVNYHEWSEPQQSGVSATGEAEMTKRDKESDDRRAGSDRRQEDRRKENSDDWTGTERREGDRRQGERRG